MTSVAAHPDRRRVTTAQAPAGEPPPALLDPPNDTDTSPLAVAVTAARISPSRWTQASSPRISYGTRRTRRRCVKPARTPRCPPRPNVQHVPVLVDGAPQILPLTVDREEYLVEVPRIAGAGPAATQPVGVGLPELHAPLPDGFVGDHDPALQIPRQSPGVSRWLCDSEAGGGRRLGSVQTYDQYFRGHPFSEVHSGDNFRERAHSTIRSPRICFREHAAG